MKQCPQCKRISNDDSLAFCLYDGQPLETIGQIGQAPMPAPVQGTPGQEIPQQGGYQQPQGNYQPQQGEYVPPQQGGYVPPQQTGHQPQGEFAPQQGGYVPSQGGYAPKASKPFPIGWVVGGVIAFLIVGRLMLGVMKAAGPGGGGSDQASVVAAVQKADDAESQAIKSLDVSGLSQYYAGNALTQVQSEVEALKQQGVYEEGHLENSQVQAVAFDGAGKNAALKVTETWSATYYNAQSKEVVKTVPAQALPQTIHLQKSDSGWIITQIDFENPAAPPGNAPGQ